MNQEWWRSAVIYQIYPRSFADSNGDGIGDLRGISSRLDSLKELGVDAVWLSPFQKSPQKDGGYDVSDYCEVDPLFGTLSDFDNLLKRAHELGLRVLIDLVPNHTSDQHEWFQKALASTPGSPERNYYHFRDGDELPNNWQSMFGGPAWTKTKDGQWYLHLFDSSQPDLNWDNPKVQEEFENILRFWLDRGVDGFRVDQPHAMGKAEGLPDHPDVERAGAGFIEGELSPPMWFQESVHPIFRKWRKILESYPGERAMCGEAYVLPLKFMAKWVRPDEFHQTFNFRYLDAGWSADSIRKTIDESLEAFGEVGAPSTWVLSNHDVMRHASRFGGEYGRATASDGIGPEDVQPNAELGLQKALGATLFTMGLPGSMYLYQGEELGLPEHTTLPSEFRLDPTFARTNGERLGRDGCRVPIPWEAGVNDSNGFSANGKSWLPQPAAFEKFSRNLQSQESNSPLNLYKNALALRKKLELGIGSFEWIEDLCSTNVLAYRNNNVVVVHNFSEESIAIPQGKGLISSMRISTQISPNETVWLTAD